MKRKRFTVRTELQHECIASPREIIENYVDYGHEVYWHGKYSRSRRKKISKISLVSHRIISDTEREVTVPVVLFGFLKWTSIQKVRLIPWTGIVSHSHPDSNWLQTKTVWEIRSEPGVALTRCHVTYELLLPWHLLPFQPVLVWLLPKLIRHLRERIWEEDRLMLERRDRLIRRGFGDGGKRPRSAGQNSDHTGLSGTVLS